MATNNPPRLQIEGSTVCVVPVSYHPWNHAWIDTRTSIYPIGFVGIPSSSSSNNAGLVSVSKPSRAHVKMPVVYTINSLVLHNRFKPSNLILQFSPEKHHWRSVWSRAHKTAAPGVDANYLVAPTSTPVCNSFGPIILSHFFVLYLDRYVCVVVVGAPRPFVCAEPVRFNSNECLVYFGHCRSATTNNRRSPEHI